MTEPVTVWSAPEALCKLTQSRFYPSPDSLNPVNSWTRKASPYGPWSRVWMADLTPAGLDRNDRAIVEGFVTRMDGVGGLMRIHDQFHQEPEYNRTARETSTWSDGTLFSDGTPWVDYAIPPSVTVSEAASLEAESLVIQGLPASVPQLFMPSDAFELRPNGIPTPFGNYYRIINWCGSDASGRTRLEFKPGLRQGFAVGDMVVLDKPTCVFRFASDAEGIVTRNASGIRATVGLSLVEELRGP